MSRWRRLLELTADHDGRQIDKLRAFELIFLMHVCARLWIWALRPHPEWMALKTTLAVAATALALAALRPACARLAVTAIAAILLGKVVATFPVTSNHALLELLAALSLASFDRRVAEERELLLQTCCWLAVIVLFWSGVQKVLYGTYFDAQFLGAFIALKPSFAETFAPLMPAAELARLRALGFSEGSGPFAVDSVAVVALSNAVYIAEIVLPFALLRRRTRSAAAAAAIVFTVALQAGARELLFGALFVNFLLLFPKAAVNRRMLPVFAAFYGSLICVRLLTPEVYFN